MGVTRKTPPPVGISPGAFAGPTTAFSNLTGSWRSERPVYTPSDAPCHTACPAHEDINRWLSFMALDDPKSAWEQLVRKNPLPAVSGRVCPHPCESSCHRGSYDQPIAIHAVERTLGDVALSRGWALPVPPLSEPAPQVAVVGAGPAGLSAAYHLRRQGCRVTLFEALSEAGGTCRTAIPSYRLDKNVLGSEVERLLATGILFQPGNRLGRDFSLADLESSYAAVFLGPGAQKSRPFTVRGMSPEYMRHGLEVLKEYQDLGTIAVWKKVVILGGGNTAMDLARVLLRTGTGEVHVVSEESLPGESDDPRDRMPGNPGEIDRARKEGVIIHANRTVNRLILRDDRTVGVELVRARKRFSGESPHHEAFEGTETILTADQVIPAIGQILEPGGLEPWIRPDHHLAVDSSGFVTGSQNTFSAGDACPGGGTVSHAIGSAYRATLAMNQFLKTATFTPTGDPLPIPYAILNLHYFEPRPRLKESPPPRELLAWDEIEETPSESDAHLEARRCLSCGSCMECDNCWTLCPDSAVLKQSKDPDRPYVFDYDYCKGCGICAHECPTGFIRMVTES